MKKFKPFKREKEYDTMTIFTDISDAPNASDTREPFDRKKIKHKTLKASDDQKTQVYEPRPLTPDDEIYDDIIEHFASAPTKPKYWFEEFGDYWSCSCGHINRGDVCKSCGLERELLRSLFILHKPAGAKGRLDKKIKKNKEQVDKEEQQHTDNQLRRKNREASGEDLTKVIPIETDSSDSDIDNSSTTEVVPVASDIPPEKKKKISFKAKAIIAIVICLVLVGAGGFAIYKHMAAPAMQYEEAVKLQEEGQYEKAIAKFEALGDYKDSKERIWECYVSMGDDFFANGEYENAIDTYNKALERKKGVGLNEKIRQCYIAIGDRHLSQSEFDQALGSYAVAADIAAGEDVQTKIYDTKFAYINAFKQDRSQRVEEYLAELMDVSYPGIKEVYDEYYAWHITIVANTSESDYSSDITTVSRKDTVYFHATLSGGEPNEKLNLYYEVSWPSGQKEIYNLDSTWESGSKITARFQYPIPLFGKEGKLTFSLYNSSTKEFLGSDSVTFKN